MTPLLLSEILSSSSGIVGLSEIVEVEEHAITNGQKAIRTAPATADLRFKPSTPLVCHNAPHPCGGGARRILLRIDTFTCLTTCLFDYKLV